MQPVAGLFPFGPLSGRIKPLINKATHKRWPRLLQGCRPSQPADTAALGTETNLQDCCAHRYQHKPKKKTPPRIESGSGARKSTEARLNLPNRSLIAQSWN